MKALILSGGSGTRLRPLTYTHAKQLLPLGNKPILFHIIEKVVNAGIHDIGIIVGQTHEEVENMVGNGERWNAQITYIYQPIPLGLAHAVKTAASFVGEDDFLMILGDNMFSMKLGYFIDNFDKSGSNVSILLHKVMNPSQFGVAAVEDGHIVKLVEKPKEYISDLIITGVYLFDHSIFEAINQIVPSKRGELEITDAIQERLNMGGKVTYDIIEGWWKDTGRLNDMLEANRLILDDLKGEYNKEIVEGFTCTGNIIKGNNVVIKNCRIEGPVMIDDDVVIIDSYIGPYTTISKGVKMDNCEVDNCIILENAQLDHVKKRITGSLIGKNVVIKTSDKRPYANSFLIGDNSEIYL